jgi:hypothetical protein
VCLQLAQFFFVFLPLRIDQPTHHSEKSCNMSSAAPLFASVPKKKKNKDAQNSETSMHSNDAHPDHVFLSKYSPKATMMTHILHLRHERTTGDAPMPPPGSFRVMKFGGSSQVCCFRQFSLNSIFMPNFGFTFKRLVIFLSSLPSQALLLCAFLFSSTKAKKRKKISKNFGKIFHKFCFFSSLNLRL